MEISREELLDALRKRIPGGVIYRANCMQALGVKLHYAAYHEAKKQGMKLPQWLRENGFTYKETGYVEDDMRTQDIPINKENAIALADSIVKKYPLIGMYEPNPEEMEILRKAAQTAFQKMCRQNGSLSDTEKLVLTVYTVQCLKSWMNESSGETDATSFWDYIYLQYGFKAENSESTEQRVYAKFREAIRKTLTRYNRFLSPEGTMRYYTSMLLHTIAPKQSAFALFNILCDFYTANLDYQYLPEDPVYNALVKGMQARWKDTGKNEVIQLRSDALSSGLKTLFLERPEYMASVCDALVSKIDRLVRGEKLELQDRWDVLLWEWYQEKSRMDRSRLQGEKHQRHTEFVATTADRITMYYVMDNDNVGIFVPKIRLPDSEATRRPRISVSQDGKVIYESDMSVTGNDLGLTTRSLFIPLRNTRMDFSGNLDIRATIEYDGEELYATGSRLVRGDYILFDGSGAERSVQTGIAYIFTTESRNVDFANESGVVQEDHPGALYRVNLNQVGIVMVNGREILVDEKQAGKARVFPTIRPISGLTVVQDNNSLLVFSKPFQIAVHIPEDEPQQRYQAIMDDRQVTFLSDECNPGGIIIDAADEPNVAHSIRLRDFEKSATVAELRYVILPGFSYSLNQTYYLETEDYAVLTVEYGGEIWTSGLARRSCEEDAARTIAPAGGWDYEVTLPVIHARLGEESLFRLENCMWYESVEKTGAVSLRLPNGWTGMLMLGTRQVPADTQDNYELGNYVRSGQSFEKSESLWLSLKAQNGEPEQLFISDLYFEPVFLEEPLWMDEESLRWLPEGCYLGKAGSRFHITIKGRRDYEFDVSDENAELAKLRIFLPGRYDYTVFLKNSGLFSGTGSTPICSGFLVVGDEDSFRFEGQELNLTSATYWEYSTDSMEESPVLDNAGILLKMRYVGDSIPTGENFELPEYEATLVFETGTGRRIAFSDTDLNGYEKINPARVWIVNDHLLILLTSEDEAVYFNIRTNTILKEDPDTVFRSRTAQEQCLRFPDYFEYTTRRA